MTISRLELTNFTVFEKVNFEFCPGINVLIGENGTGKSHVLKAMYSMVRTVQEAGSRPPHELVYSKFSAVFGIAGNSYGRLIRRGPFESFCVEVTDSSGANAGLNCARVRGRVGKDLVVPSAWQRMSVQPAIFVPPREVLAMYRGFVAAYEGRELAFDETYYDLCKALSAAPLRGLRAKAIEPMLAPLEQIMGGKVVLEGDRFFVKQVDGETEAHLVAEGLRKIASIAHLVANGSLTADSVLFWDEPEAGLNPALVVKVVDFLRTLAASGVQVFLASHDFLLVHRLSQAVEYDVKPAVPVRFFSLFRPDPGAPVEVEQADTLVDIEHNAILDEFARYYDREQDLAARAMNDAQIGDLPDPPVTAKVRAKKTSATKKKSAKKQTKAPARKAAKKVARA